MVVGGCVWQGGHGAIKTFRLDQFPGFLNPRALPKIGEPIGLLGPNVRVRDL